MKFFFSTELSQNLSDPCFKVQSVLQFCGLPSCLYPRVFSTSGLFFLHCLHLSALYIPIHQTQLEHARCLSLSHACSWGSMLQQKCGSTHEGGVCEAEESNFKVHLRHSDFKMHLMIPNNKFLLVSHSPWLRSCCLHASSASALLAPILNYSQDLQDLFSSPQLLLLTSAPGHFHLNTIQLATEEKDLQFNVSQFRKWEWL